MVQRVHVKAKKKQIYLPDRIGLRLQRGSRDRIWRAARKLGISPAAWLRRVIDAALEP